MVKRRKALGRGLEALLGEKSKKYNSNIFKEINIDEIKKNNNQPRSNFNEKQLNELAESISTHGIIQPITVRKINENTYQLISGERRFRASKILKLKSIPAFIKNAKDDEMLEIALIENIQRENLNSLEIAISYKKLIDEFKPDFVGFLSGLVANKMPDKAGVNVSELNKEISVATATATPNCR